MRSSVKIIAILIILTVFVGVIACNKTNSPNGDISTPSVTYTVIFSSQFNNTESTTVMPNPTSKTVIPPATTIDALPTPPSMSGYTFGGWYPVQNGIGTEFTASTPIAFNATVYAYWFKYKVTFMSDGATIAIRGTVPPATTVDAIPAAAKTGYNFAGWWTGLNGSGNEFTFITEVPPAGIIVYAKWISTQVRTVTYASYSTSGISGYGTQYAADTGDPATAFKVVGTLPTPTNPCKTFEGWWTGIDGKGIQFTNDITVDGYQRDTNGNYILVGGQKIYDGNMTVYAKWSTNIVRTVIYNSGWGSNAGTQCVTEPDFKVVDTLPTPTKQCYTFKGWWTGTNGAGIQFTNDIPVDGNRRDTNGNLVDGDPVLAGVQPIYDGTITVYAKWEWAPTFPTPPFHIGDPGPSCIGKVFYITDDGLHGLEAAPPGWSGYVGSPDPSSIWISGDSQGTLNGNTSTAIGTGLANSNAIITQSGPTGNSAAKLCEDYDGGGPTGKTGWFLPSKDELADLYAHRDVTRWGGFSADDGYWSSSEFSEALDAWSQYFTNGTQTGTYKSSDRLVRPVRAFDNF